MAYTQASNKAVQKYNKKAYDDLRIRVKKGEGDIIKTHAKTQGESLNSFVLSITFGKNKREQAFNAHSPIIFTAGYLHFACQSHCINKAFDKAVMVA